MLVQAQVKSIDCQPDWMKCCPEATQELAKISGQQFLVKAGATKRLIMACGFCHQVYRDYKAAITVDHMLLPADALDIDEGEYDQ